MQLFTKSHRGTTWLRLGPCPVSLGGDNRDRTDDPLLAKQVLSQLSYTPVAIFFKGSTRTSKIKQRKNLGT